MKMDRAHPQVTQSGFPAAASSPIIRAMANTLCDHGINPYDSIRVAVQLIASGFPACDIERYWEAVVMMTSIRQANEVRKKKTTLVERLAAINRKKNS